MKKQYWFTTIPIYTIGFFFNMIFSLTSIIIPLYGVSVGYSATQIGILLSIPGILQIVLRMFAGLLSDRFGEKKVLAFSHGLTMATGIIFTFPLSFLTIAVFQILIGLSRTFFWPSSQSYASRISGSETSSIIGRLFSFNQAGRIFGMMFAGGAIIYIGYLNTFRFIAVLGFLGLLINWVMKSIPLAAGERKKVNNVGGSFRKLLKFPPLQLALITAFFAGLLTAIIQSFFPVWLKSLGNPEGLISVIITAQLAGSMIAGRLFQKMLGKLGFPLLMQFSLGGVGIGLLLVAVVKGLLTVFTLTLIIGFLVGNITLSYQLMVVNNSLESNRGLIYAFVGLGWAIAIFIGPILFGLLVDGSTISVAFACLGLLILLYSVLTKTVFSHFVDSNRGTQDVSS